MCLSIYNWKGFGNMKPVIVVHGGAGRIFKEREDGSRSGVIRASLKGYSILKQGGSALDAVEQAVTLMEDDPHFNAGCGSVLNQKGEVEMDAIIMDGKNLASGAVSAVKCIANPIKLARLVMEKTKHMLLADYGAQCFAKAMGVPEIPGEKLITERSRERWMKNLEPDSNPHAFQTDLGTVGAVAIDSEGNVACATSTGGLTNKLVGRVGDTACIGSGGYADNHVGATSTTGHGESIMKVVLARLILYHMEQGMSPEEASDTALNCMKTRVGGLGGVVVVSSSGDWAARFSTKQMSWATVKDDQLYYGIYTGERLTKSFEEALTSEGF
ncbi:PREDICTED: isoaspartyl peptidase/L-asparaginase isoform X1 [Gavialis gangeticus]|uniref:isoaspartyl peptidase/L-asparaginase isoform X1 n=2 Tax=Gavialis gangeticus TaxID=94835 RepID=UPI00092EA645|nr:PREDICTED: isoaspartyl peptidase/L-asparaginase isoform X1 [Gavialis gangeticus]